MGATIASLIVGVASMTIALVFGNSTAGGAYVPGMSDYTVMVKEQAKVFLGGPPLVKMATGEESDDESLGGAEMHARTSGLADYLAEDEHDALRIGRRIVARLNWRKATTETGYAEPDADPDGLLDLIPADLKEPFDPREVILRICDGTGPGNAQPFDEFKPLYGTSLVTGWARLHGRPIGILANAQGVLFSEEAQKATQFVQLANQTDTPLLFLHNTTGYMVGKEYEQGGIIKHGAMMINAISNSTVPHLSVIMGASYGAGNYGMNGRAFDPRFLFTWPSAKSAVMGPAQLAGVLEIVAQQSAESKGQTFDAEGFKGIKEVVEAQIEEQSLAHFLSGMLYDDGVIDPRDTRTVLGICLSVIDNVPVRGTDRFGVRTLVRLLLTRRRLLEWVPARQTRRRLDLTLAGFFSRMAPAVLLAAASGLAVALVQPGALPVALPLLAAWLFSPAVARWISLPPSTPEEPLAPSPAGQLAGRTMPGGMFISVEAAVLVTSSRPSALHSGWNTDSSGPPVIRSAAEPSIRGA